MQYYRNMLDFTTKYSSLIANRKKPLHVKKWTKNSKELEVFTPRIWNQILLTNFTIVVLKKKSKVSVSLAVS